MGKDPERSLFNLVFVELDNHAEELWDQSKRSMIIQSLSALCVKRFGQVHKRYIQYFFLLTAFLLELSEDEHYICGVPVSSEPTLGFW